MAQQGIGKGSALRTGFLAATGDVIVMMDADDSMTPQEIPHDLHFLANGHDFAGGSRSAGGGGSRDIIRRRTLSKTEVLERDEILRSLLGHLEQAASGHGRLVLLHGEAGVGKTTVVRRLSELVEARARTLAGGCDPLTTPRPLGPLVDITPRLGPAVERALTATLSGASSPFEVFRCLLEDLDTHRGRASEGRAERQPTLLVFEDVHWADEATLDLLRYLGRRIETTSVLLAVTYRDDAIGRMHPLTVLLGDLASCPAVHRHRVEPLSKQAVAQLAAGRRIDIDRLYEVTDGNPFFVTEVLAAESDEVPTSVRQAVRGRLAWLSEQAYAVVEAAAVIGSSAPLKLIAAMVPESESAITTALACGVLQPHGHTVKFGHELARMAVLEAIPDYRRIQLHGLVLEALASRPVSADELTLMAYHAEQAECGTSVLKYSLAAARHASALGAHRQAVDQYDRILRHAVSLRQDERGVLLENRAYECYLSGDITEAISSWQAALQLRRTQGDRLREGNDLRWISHMLWLTGRMSQAIETGRHALSVLETLEPSPELGWAYANLCQLAAYAHDADMATTHARSAITLGERFGEPGIAVSARFHERLAQLIHTGQGWQELEEILDQAVEERLVEHAALFASLICFLATLNRDFDRALPATERALTYCVEHDLTTFALFVRGVAAVGMLHRGLWTEAADAASAVLARPSVPPISRILPLTVLGLVRARRGDPDVWPVLDEALNLGEPGDLLRLGPVWEARAEAAWLGGDDARAIAEARLGLTAVTPHSSVWLVGGLARWIHRAGGAPPDVPMPKVLNCETNGDWQAAVQTWDQAGCTYDAALARLDGHAAALRQALAAFQALEARPAVTRTRARLKTLGVRQVASGPHTVTRANPYQLTKRELEILALLREDLSDAEIGGRLYITRRTASNHVSAILTKLGVRTRHEAVRKLHEMLPDSDA